MGTRGKGVNAAALESTGRRASRPGHAARSPPVALHRAPLVAIDHRP